MSHNTLSYEDEVAALFALDLPVLLEKVHAISIEAELNRVQAVCDLDSTIPFRATRNKGSMPWNELLLTYRRDGEITVVALLAHYIADHHHRRQRRMSNPIELDIHIMMTACEG